MMREIEFRTWDSLRKKFITGIDLCIKFHDYGAMYHCAYDNEGNEAHLPLLQYTGLKDKNGVKIFEGDLIDCYSYGQYIVVWSPESACFDTDLNGKCHELFMLTNLFELNGSKTTLGINSVEVIGNKFENPDLMETE